MILCLRINGGCMTCNDRHSVCYTLHEQYCCESMQACMRTTIQPHQCQHHTNFLLGVCTFANNDGHWHTDLDKLKYFTDLRYFFFWG